MEADLTRRFSGLDRLWGPDASERLAQSHVVVVGVGGVGSWSVEALARSGIGRLTLIDFDQVADGAHRVQQNPGGWLRPVCLIN